MNQPTFSKKIILILLSLTGFAFGIYLLIGAFKTIISIIYISGDALGIHVIRRILAGLLLVTLRIIITVLVIFPYSASLWHDAFSE
jgi:flagellar biosynthesis protein FliP